VGLLGLLVIGLGIHVPISNARLYLVYIYNITFIRQIDIIKYFIMFIRAFSMLLGSYPFIKGIFL